MARVKADPTKRPPTAGNRGDDESISAEQAEALAKMSPKQNGTTKKVIEEADYLRESALRMVEAGSCIKEWLLNGPDGEIWDNFDNLSAGQLECLSMAT